jgi:hypothetical protein
MFEAYAIGVTLRLNNLVSAQLQLLTQEVGRLDGLVATLNLSLKRLGGESSGLKAITSAGRSTTVALDNATRSAANLERQLVGLKAAGTMPSLPTPVALPGPAGGGGRGGGRHVGPHGGNIHMGPNGPGLGTVGFGVGSEAFIPLAVTAGMVWGGHALYESAKDLNTEMARFKLFGLGDKLNNEAYKFVEGMKIYGSSQAENMKNFREAQGVFRESGLNDSLALEGAKLAAPVLSKIAFATASLDEEAQARIRTSSMAMLRYVEMSGGLKDAATFNRLADFGFKMVTTSGGTVDWEQLRQFKAISGISSKMMTDEAMAMAEPLMAELKGGGAGTGLRTAFNRLNGIIKIPNQVAHTLVDHGLWDKNKIVFNSNGGIKTFKGNPFKQSQEFQENAWLWYEKNILPMYEQMKLDDAGRNQFDAMLFGGTGGRLFSLVRQQLPVMHRSAVAQSKALSIDKAGDVSKEALSGQEVEFGKAWTDFKTQFGNMVLPTFSAILRDGAEVLRAIGDFMRDNAETIAKIKTFIGYFPNPLNPMGGAMKTVRGFFAEDPKATLPETVRLGTGKAPMASLRGLSPTALDGSAKDLLGSSFAARGASPYFAARATNASTTATVQPTAQPPIQVSTEINIDGRKVAQAVTQHQSRELNRPFASSSGFDPTLTIAPVGMR